MSDSTNRPLFAYWVFASHAFNGDGLALLARPLVLLAVLLGSYFLMPLSRRLA